MTEQQIPHSYTTGRQRNGGYSIPREELPLIMNLEPAGYMDRISGLQNLQTAETPGSTWVLPRDLRLAKPMAPEILTGHPEVIYNDGIYHMYVSYVEGIHSNWGGASNIEHYTSKDLINWDHQSSVPGQPSGRYH